MRSRPITVRARRRRYWGRACGLRSRRRRLSGTAKRPSRCWPTIPRCRKWSGANRASRAICRALARRLATEHATGGQKYVSAPVFGRPETAAVKKLLVVAAGEGEIVERCSPVFEAIGRQTFVAGKEPWQANAVKLCGNFMIASMIESFGEAYATLRKAEVGPHLFLDVMAALFGSPVYSNYGRLIADENFKPAGFALRLGFKDVRLAIETARECASPMPIASLLHDRLLEAIALGMAEIDWSGVAQISAIHAGL